jgi:GH15 family glucan-1,4-alpha-glucosidase
VISDPLGDERYPPIGSHGAIGDLQTVALVSTDATIDFWCLPDFDSPTVFAGLLDAARGGHFGIAPADGVARSQRYVRDTNVLVTRFAAGRADVEVVDFMPMARQPAPSRIVRQVTAREAPATIRLRCAPRFGYALSRHTTTIAGNAAVMAGDDGTLLRLTTDAPLTVDGDDVVAEVRLDAGARATFVLEHLARFDTPMLDDHTAARLLRQTIVYWRRWIGRCAYRGAWRVPVRRSALVLALLHSRRTGGIVAAPTFGLPEQIGGDRNWDFRYMWIRDASFTMYALSRLGMHREGEAFTRWIEQRCAEAARPGELQTMYGVDGRRELPEQHLDHLDGYRGSRPVRIGNAAHEQFQLDIYGELLDALYVHDEHGGGTSRAAWTRIVELVNWVCDNWRRPDQGIWEVRSGCQEFLYSRVMCWVAVDRALRIGIRRRFSAPVDRWRAARGEIRTDILANFWNAGLEAFVGTRSSSTIDAACLVMPLVGFLPPDDPRWLSTLRAIEERLVRDALVRRYDMHRMDTDAAAESAPAFSICSFWYVECLARAGRRADAEQAMGRLLAHANHLGLFSEDIGPDGELLGNFPQALTHLALIGAAIALEPAS